MFIGWDALCRAESHSAILNFMSKAGYLLWQAYLETGEWFGRSAALDVIRQACGF